MIPILYEKTETQFANNGIGLLSDCIYCNVTEERNGIYECEFQYPQTGIHFDDITEGRIIACTHDEAGDLQAFDIYKSSKVIDGIVTFYARHISYRQNEIAVKPFTSQSCAGAIQALKTNSINTNPFSYWTDKAVDGEYKVEAIRGLRGLLGGEQGSLLDRYGTGEYEWDNFTTKLHLHRGKDTDVEIRYGKNLMDLTDESDFSDTYNGVAPYWIGTQMSEEGGEQEEISVTLPEWAIYSQNTTYGSRDIVVPLDLSGSFQEPPTVEQLRTKAESHLNNSILPNRNLNVDFIQLWQTEEYAAYAPLERCKLCDTVTVIHTALNISTRQKIIRVVWDVLMDRYAEMELGDAKSTYSTLVRELVDPELEEIEQQLKAVTQVADNTNQYFWHTEVESSVGANDTGAHITEITREEFMDDPAHGGPNLLMRSNGIALRDGVTELARFKANGIQIGKDTEANVELLSDSLTFYGDDLEKALEASSDGVTAYISGVAAASFTTSGIEFNDELPMTIGNSTTFIKWVKENNTWKLKIQADEVEIGGVPALTTQDQLTITNIEYAYQLGSSGTTPPSGTWSSSPVASTKTQYAWTRTTVTYSDGHQAISYSVAGLAGQDGQDGQDGHDGSDGQDGTSVSITSTSVKYATSSSGTTAPSSGWSDSVPTVSQGNYLWTRTIVTYSNGSSTTSYSVARQGVNGTDITSQYLSWGRNTGLTLGYSSSIASKINLKGDGVRIYNGSGYLGQYLSASGMTIYDGTSNERTAAEFTQTGCSIYATSGQLEIAHFGYGLTNKYDGTTTNAPFYTIGTRASGSNIGKYSVAEGVNQTASGENAHAEGNGGTSRGYNSHTEGYQCTAYSSCHAEGYKTWARGRTDVTTGAAHAEGNETTADGEGTHAGGIGTIAVKFAQRAIGQYNVEDTGQYNLGGFIHGTYALIIGNGTHTQRSNAFTVSWTGAVQAAGSVTQNSSDRRLKEHIRYLGLDAERFVRNLKPVYYRKDGACHVGFYAQDVEAIDEWHCMTGEMNGFKTLGYAEIIAPLVSYCQSLERRIENLERS